MASANGTSRRGRPLVRISDDQRRARLGRRHHLARELPQRRPEDHEQQRRDDIGQIRKERPNCARDSNQTESVGAGLGQHEQDKEIHEARNKQIQLLAQADSLKSLVNTRLFHEAVEADSGQHVSQDNFD